MNEMNTWCLVTLSNKQKCYAVQNLTVNIYEDMEWGKYLDISIYVLNIQLSFRLTSKVDIAVFYRNTNVNVE